MNIPKLDAGEFSLMIAEYATGHVFKKDLTIYLEGQDETEVFQVFNSLKTATEFCQTFLKNRPEFECSVYNHLGKHLVTFDKIGKRQ